MLPSADPAAAIVSQRRYACTPDQLFEAFARPERLARWWGPSGFRNTFDTFELRPGGHWRFTMHGPDGTDYANHSVFLEVDAPRRVVLDHQPQPYFRMTLTLAPDGPGHTVLHWHMAFEDAAMRDRIAVYAVPANEQNFDRLQAVLDGRDPA